MVNQSQIDQQHSSSSRPCTVHQQTSKPPACSSLQHQASGHIQRPLACDPRVQPVPDNPAASCCSQGEGGQALSCGPSSMAAACGGATRRGQRARGVGRYRDGNGTGTPHRNGRKHRRLRREWRCSGGRRCGGGVGGEGCSRLGRGEASGAGGCHRGRAGGEKAWRCAAAVTTLIMVRARDRAPRMGAG